MAKQFVAQLEASERFRSLCQQSSQLDYSTVVSEPCADEYYSACSAASELDSSLFPQDATHTVLTKCPSCKGTVACHMKARVLDATRDMTRSDEVAFKLRALLLLTQSSSYSVTTKPRAYHMLASASIPTRQGTHHAMRVQCATPQPCTPRQRCRHTSPTDAKTKSMYLKDMESAVILTKSETYELSVKCLLSRTLSDCLAQRDNMLERWIGCWSKSRNSNRCRGRLSC